MTSEQTTTGFSQESTASEVIHGIDLSGKRAIVTGGSSGIGVETARALSSAGAEVTLAVRDVTSGEQVAGEISGKTGNPVHVGRVELADPTSVAEFAAGWSGPLHLLVNNAGIMAVPERELTNQGWELHFATNHLGHLGLAQALHDSLAAAGSARIVSLTSRGHVRSPVVFNDIQFAERAYDPYLAYGQSKTANILFAVEATRRWAADGIVANAVHPGAIEATRLGRHIPQQGMQNFKSNAIYTWKTVGQGAATSVLVASSPSLDGVGGRYFEDCNPAEVLPEGTDFAAVGHGVAWYAVDPGNAERLWDISTELLAANS
jgi:NAD(P)-dependent dehydrogenase (short-subunit alcohol dehydrogenase family)